MKPATRLRLWAGGLIAAGLFGVVLLLRIPVLSVPLLVSMGLSYLLEPLLRRWERHGRRRRHSLALLTALLAITLVTIGFVAEPLLRQQWELLQAQTPEALRQLDMASAGVESWARETLPFLDEFRFSWPEFAAARRIHSGMLQAIPALSVQILTGTLLVPIITFFVLRDGRKLRNGILRLVPNRHFEMTLNILHQMDRQFSAYIRAVVPQSLLVGLLAFVVMRLLGVPGAALIGGVIGLTNVVPYFGPVAGLFVGALYCVFAGVPELAYRGVLPAVILAQLADNLLIGPMLIGRAVNVHPLVVIFLLILAGSQFGVLGLLVAFPLWVMVRAVVTEVARATTAYGRFLID